MDKGIQEELQEVNRRLQILMKDPQQAELAQLLAKKMSLEAERALKELSQGADSHSNTLFSRGAEFALIQKWHTELLRLPLKIEMRLKIKDE